MINGNADSVSFKEINGVNTCLPITPKYLHKPLFLQKCLKTCFYFQVMVFRQKKIKYNFTHLC